MVPIFDGESYEMWVIQMKTLMRSHGLWDLVQSELKPENEAMLASWDTTKKNQYKEDILKDAKALFFIQQGVTKDILPIIKQAETAKEAWEILRDAYKGSDEAAQEDDDFKSLNPYQIYHKSKIFWRKLDLSRLARLLDSVRNSAKENKSKIDFFENLLIKYFADLLVTESKNIPFMSDIFRNPTFIGVYHGHYELVDAILNFYHQFKEKFDTKPWLVKDSSERTPLHVALVERQDDCAKHILSSIDDIEEVCNLVDSAGNTPLFLAVKNGCEKSALYILMYVCSPNLNGEDRSTAVHFAMNSPEEVLTRLLDKDPKCIKTRDKSGNTALHIWIESKNTWPVDYVFGESGKQHSISPESKKDLMDLIYAQNNDGNNPFHIAAKYGLDQVCKILTEAHKQQLLSSSSSSDDHDLPKLPWLVPNNEEEIPLGLAIRRDDNNVESVDEFNSLRAMVRIIRKPLIQGKRDLLFKAIELKKFSAADAILDIQDKYSWSMYRSRREMWSAALDCSDEEVAVWMVDRNQDLFSDRHGGDLASVLHSASQNGKARLIEQMLKKNPSALKGNQSMVWIHACQGGHYLAVKAFIENCRYFKKLCFEEKDSPLHNVCFETEKEYEDILKIPAMWALKNFQDCNGDTPLHKAIKEHNILLAKLLLETDGVVPTIKNKDGNTAYDLLTYACKKDWKWDEMCNEIGIVPGLQMTYFRDKTNLFAVRDSLLVVASLLATITFAAGFTLPGGFKSDDSGKAVIGDKTVFLLFLLSDTVAMCCSMLAVVCFLWSTVCEYNRALLLIDRSIPVMAMALCSTLVAFMTGVYVVMPTKSRWAAILVLIMCSFIVFISIRRIMHKFFDLVHPELGRHYNLRINDLEEGETSSSVEGNNGS